MFFFTRFIVQDTVIERDLKTAMNVGK